MLKTYMQFVESPNCLWIGLALAVVVLFCAYVEFKDGMYDLD